MKYIKYISYLKPINKIKIKIKNLDVKQPIMRSGSKTVLEMVTRRTAIQTNCREEIE
jgi:hypothetical protein